MSERDPNAVKGIAIFNQNVWEGRVNQRAVGNLSLAEAIQSLEAVGIRAGCESKGTNGSALVVATAPEQIQQIKTTMAELGLGAAQVVSYGTLNTLAPAAAAISQSEGSGAGCRVRQER